MRSPGLPVRRLPAQPRAGTRAGASPGFRAHAVRPRDGRLLLVALHHLRPSDVGCARVATGFVQGPALAQQVPALVERDLQLFEAPSVSVAPLAGRLPLPELVLLGDELLNGSVDPRIVHRSSLLRFRVSCEQSLANPRTAR